MPLPGGTHAHKVSFYSLPFLFVIEKMFAVSLLFVHSEDAEELKHDTHRTTKTTTNVVTVAMITNTTTTTTTTTTTELSSSPFRGVDDANDVLSATTTTTTTKQFYWHWSHGIYETVRCPSVCVSHSPAAAACGGFAAVGPADRRHRSTAAAAAGECEQHHVGSVCRHMNTNLFRNVKYVSSLLALFIHFPIYVYKISKSTLLTTATSVFHNHYTAGG